MRPIVFRVAASEQIGLGHLMRCLALAQAAEDAGISVVFALDAGAVDFARARHDWNYPIVPVPADLTDCKHSEWLYGLLQKQNAPVLVVDGYIFTPDIFSHIPRDVVCTIVMDDGQQHLAQYADIIVNPATQTLDESYKKANPDVICATGDKYRLLRREFRTAQIKPLESRQGIAINFGGSDPLHLTLPLLKAITASNADIPIRVVTGPACEAYTEIADWAATSPAPIQHIHNCQDMAEVWCHARLAISAAGGSQFELGVCQTPTLLVVVAENQVAATSEAMEQGWCLSFDGRKRNVVSELAEKSISLYEENSLLSGMSEKAAQHYDVDGADRLLELLAEKLR